MLTKRMKVCIAAGAILGIVCIIGAQLRSGFGRDASYLFAFWYNRLLMGVVIGLAGGNLGLPKALGRGALLGSSFLSLSTVPPASMMLWASWQESYTASSSNMLRRIWSAIKQQ